MELFPESRKHAWSNDRACHGHIWVQVTDVVNIRFAFQQGNDRANDALKRWIGHGHDGIAGHKERARNRQRDVAEVIQHAFFHAETRKVGRTGTNDAHSVHNFSLVRAPWASLCGIVGWAPAEHRQAMRRGESFHDGMSHLGGRGSIRRVIEIQQQDAHGEIVLSSASVRGAVAQRF